MTDAPAPVQRMVEATNAADSDAFVACFAPDAYLEDWGRGFHGREGVAAWDRTDNIGVHMHFEVDAARRDGDDWVVTLVSTGGGYNGTSEIRFRLDGDLIARMIIAG
ncbi:hypothetical protein GCM10009840_31570 [Pseudolysinimonas kribbensis]|uniref:SnoaL-like domain-containing protein n=1 Tax=Pseudolysinimonas kribbensis TaxID=433641 RepID=A0ABQ6K5S8_9MICO|nr:nuclear transport factor 2 family protein [Pseudolysinimonas kribbensis]GMA95970.1 hypothetical protein GCM10025881_27940 [Pseudolysinimonas kribbensis]